MKRVKNLTIAVLFTVMSTGMVVAQDLSDIFEYDNGRENVRVETSSYARYKLVYPVRSKEMVNIKIYDQKNQLVFSDRIKNLNGFIRPYDLSYLPDGNYKFMIRSTSGFITRDIVHKAAENDLRISIEETGANDSYKLIVKGVSRNPVSVDIYNKEVGLVFKENIKIGKDFSRIYSFKNKVDNLTFIVTQNNSSVIKRIK